MRCCRNFEIPPFSCSARTIGDGGRPVWARSGGDGPEAEWLLLSYNDIVTVLLKVGPV